MSSWLDHLPSTERAKIRKRLRSPEEYERLRERVKGPEDLEREMRSNEALAELQLDAELMKMSLESMKESIGEQITEQGIESIVENADNLPEDVQQAMEQGNFSLEIEKNPQDGSEQIAIRPEGNVSEKIPVKKTLSDEIIGGLQA